MPCITHCELNGFKFFLNKTALWVLLADERPTPKEEEGFERHDADCSLLGVNAHDIAVDIFKLNRPNPQMCIKSKELRRD